MIKYLIFLNFYFVVNCWPTFELYTKQRPDQYILVKASNLENLGFDRSKETKLVVHGFSADSSSLTAIKNKLLIFDDVNVIMVNWKEGAKAPDYYNAFTNVREVAQKIADFVQQGKIDLSKVHCIGHSLGAHVCGFAGKRIVGKIGRISGLDPAGPLFEGKPVYSRLDKTDAEFVDIIHTDATLGIQDSIGHLDFYPNGGRVQPGCLFKLNDLANKTINDDRSKMIELRMEPKGKILNFLSCSHTRSHLYYSESIGKCYFRSVLCNSYDNFKSENCKISSCASTLAGCAIMGYKAHKYHPNGKYFLDTNKTSPFC